MSTEPNEILATAREMKEHREAAEKAEGDKTRHWPLARIGLGVGIGSAAVAAAVLFANRQRGAK